MYVFDDYRDDCLDHQAVGPLLSPSVDHTVLSSQLAKGPYTPGTRRRDANMRMIRQPIFSIHTECDANVCLKFTQRLKFEAPSVAPEEKKSAKWKFGSGQYAPAKVEDTDLERF